MTDTYCILLSLIVFLPALGAIIVACLPRTWVEATRAVTFAVTVVVFALAVFTFMMPATGISTSFASVGEAAARMQDVFNYSWIPSFEIEYFMGVDGISFPLVILTAFISMLAMAASWSITKHVKAYCILFLLLETGMLGVFLALDFFLFYVFWEVMLLPMYFLIGVWGGPRREYAAIKFFLYTLVGSVLMLVAILLLYFNSDMRVIASMSDLLGDASGTFAVHRNLSAHEAGLPATGPLDWSSMHIHPRVESRLGITHIGDQDKGLKLVRTGGSLAEPLEVSFVYAAVEQPAALYDQEAGNVEVRLAENATAAGVVQSIRSNPWVANVVTAVLPKGSDGSDPINPQDSAGANAAPLKEVILPAVDRDTPVHSFNLLALAAMGQHTTLFDDIILGQRLQWWAFVLLFIGFAIKVPSVPVHTWLPDAHVEAPTPISMILAGILLKMGGYGIIRICYPICPHGGYDLAYVVCAIGVISMVYGAFAALAQTDFKRLVAYSSVSHMGYVVLGLGVWSAQSYTNYNPSYWNQGIQGAMFQMIAHGISSAGMFFMVGVIYDRVHHRNLNEFGGLFGKMPVYTAFSIGLFFAGLGLPGLCGFIGEVFVVLSVWNYSKALAVISAAVVILTAAYILWTLQRVYLGAEYRGPHEEEIRPSTLRENLIAGTLFVFAIVLGVFPYRIPVLNAPSALAYMEPTVKRQVGELAQWTKQVKEPQLLEVAGSTQLVGAESKAAPEVVTTMQEKEPGDDSKATAVVAQPADDPSTDAQQDAVGPDAARSDDAPAVAVR